MQHPWIYECQKFDEALSNRTEKAVKSQHTMILKPFKDTDPTLGTHQQI